MTKKQAQNLHTARRFEERYGCRYSQHVRDALLAAIRSGSVRLVCRVSTRLTVFDVPMRVRSEDCHEMFGSGKDLVVRAVYDSFRKNVVTVLGPDMHPADIGGLREFYLG